MFVVLLVWLEVGGGVEIVIFFKFGIDVNFGYRKERENRIENYNEFVFFFVNDIYRLFCLKLDEFICLLGVF